MIPGLGRSPGEGKGYPFPVFWPEEFHGLCSPWDRKESDTTKSLSLLHYIAHRNKFKGTTYSGYMEAQFIIIATMSKIEC